MKRKHSLLLEQAIQISLAQNETEAKLHHLDKRRVNPMNMKSVLNTAGSNYGKKYTDEFKEEQQKHLENQKWKAQKNRIE